MSGWIDSVIAFLGAHGAWAFWIALVFAFCENLAFLSIAIPSTAILGATVSWFLGLIYGDLMLRIWPLKNYPQLVQRGKDELAKWGPAVIVIGHFFGPLRPVAFLLCGMALMPFGKFQLYNIAGAIGWAFFVPKFGEVGGLLIGWIWRLFSGS